MTTSQPTPSPLPDHEHTGLVVVDHGSRRAASNEMLEQFVRMYRENSSYRIIEPAHMELAEPSIATAFTRCVQRGARRVVVAPYFLAPGKHWTQDIPALTADAAANHPGIDFMVSAPIGLHQLMCQLIESRVNYCLAHAAGQVDACDVCRGTDACRLRTREHASA